MRRIGIISDTHGYIDDRIIAHFQDCDEIWHLGDFGTWEVAEELAKVKPVRGVYGNIDGQKIRQTFPEHKRFQLEGVSIWLTHIGGYPGKYNPKIREHIYREKPDLFLCGHSHIAKVMKDPKIPNLLHINPGAAGKHGFHKIRTIAKMDLNNGKIENLKMIELGKRV
ncbi:MAG: metallophosphoesterase family protein [Cytophagales bacterium]|nr:metallophosphoesterase family protein [Cytophagales bacterium]